jgi:hypothetical protein
VYHMVTQRVLTFQNSGMVIVEVPNSWNSPN